MLSWPVLCARLGGRVRSDGAGRWLGGRQRDWGIQCVQLRNRRQKGSPSIPARPHPPKNTGNFKNDEKFVPGLKPRLRLFPPRHSCSAPVPSASAGKSPTVNRESAYRRNRSSHSRPLTPSLALRMTRPPQNSVEDKHKPNQCEDNGSGVRLVMESISR